MVFCEGTRTERDYIDFLKLNAYPSLVQVNFGAGGATPKTLVDRAAKAIAAGEAEEFDEIWCVCDVDDHLDLPDAVQKAKPHSIRMAISNPSFELWLVLHFNDQTAALSRKVARTKCQGYLPSYDKALPSASIEKLAPLYDNACRRAKNLRRWQTRNGRGSHTANPWTDFDRLSEKIRQIASPLDFGRLRRPR